MKPMQRPQRPFFSSGPCAKRPGWSVDALQGACLGRSHRSTAGRAKLGAVIDQTRALLGVPADYRIGIVPASDTGAMEMAMWSMLGAVGVDVLAWESFSKGWMGDIVQHLKLQDVRTFDAPYGQLPGLNQTSPQRDVVFVWNGTTSGVKVPNGDWIDDARTGLTLCDATSAVFSVDLPWTKLDVTTFSWQKVLGGEGQHGMLILSPRAIERLTSYTPPWPLPKLFRMTKADQLIEGIFRGDTINTPSLLCVEDVLDALSWVEKIGGLPATIARSEENLAAVTEWVEASGWAGFLAEEPETRSSTSMCLKIVDPELAAAPASESWRVAKRVASRLEEEGVAFDIGAYRDAPPGLRLWGGATVETADLAALFPWLDWAFTAAMASTPSL